MKGIVTGEGPDGRSRVEREVDLAAAEGIGDLWPAGPPTLPFGGGGEPRDLGVGPGAVRWLVARFEPGQEFPMHWTRTLDLDTVLAGSIELVLDEGSVLLEPGDCAVVAGVRHGWRAGPEGCTFSVAVIGVAG